MKRIWQFLQKENLHYVLLWVVILVSLSSTVIALLEPDISLIDSIWWSIVTLTTVGYGDFSPVTAGGRLIAVIIMFFGIGLLGMLSATLASVLISKRLRENKGMTSYNFQDHIVLCEWNHRARAILKELRADSHTQDTPVVLIADIDEKPVDDPDLYFIKGAVNDDALAKAGAAQAGTVVILGDDQLEETARDAKVVLSTLTVESICPDAYTVVELVDDERVQVTAEYGNNPSVISPVDTRGFGLIAATIRGMNEEIVVAPYMLQGGTDAKYFYSVSDNVYRFLMFNATSKTLKYAHGIDEQVPVEEYLQAIRFYYHLIRQSMAS